MLTVTASILTTELSLQIYSALGWEITTICTHFANPWRPAVERDIACILSSRFWIEADAKLHHCMLWQWV